MSFVDALRRCRTPADFYRQQILVENLATPTDIAALLDAGDVLPAQAKNWCSKIAALMRAGGRPIQGFERTPLADSVSVCADPAIPPSEKTLLVSFAGNYPYRPLALPLCVFLQHVDARRFDILLLRDPTQTAYANGIPGFAEGVTALAERLRVLFESRGNRRLVTIGMSSGGAAALYVGALSAAERAISVSGLDLSSERFASKRESSGLDGGEFDRALGDRVRDCSTRALCLFGADHAEDRRGALSLVARFPADRAHVVGFAGISSHLLTHEMLKQGRLGSLLETVLDGDPWTVFRGASA